MKSALTIFVVLFLGGLESVRAASTHYTGPETWVDFQRTMDEQAEKDRITGLSYMLSGGVATLGGIAGYASADDSLSKGAFAIAQTVGVAAIGFGASTYWNGNEYRSFYLAVRESQLTTEQKTDLLRRYLAHEKEQRQHSRWIRAATHFALGALNFYSASREPNADVRGLFQFLGTVNAVIGFSYSFD